MPFPSRILALAGAASLLLSAHSALAGRAPTAEERPQIEAALRAQGYTVWEEIEFNDGVWKVEEAKTPDGKEYNLKLQPGSLQVISREDD